MEKSYTKRYESFVQILENLEKAKNEDKSNLFVLSGIIMIFNLTFEGIAESCGIKKASGYCKHLNDPYETSLADAAN